MDSKAMINSATKVAENMVYDSPIVTGRANHKLRKFINRISNVWSGHRQILKATNNGVELRRIGKGSAQLNKQGWWGQQ